MSEDTRLLTTREWWRLHGDALCEMLNIDPRHIINLAVHLPFNGAVMVSVDRYVLSDHDRGYAIESTAECVTRANDDE